MGALDDDQRLAALFGVAKLGFDLAAQLRLFR